MSTLFWKKMQSFSTQKVRGENTAERMPILPEEAKKTTHGQLPMRCFWCRWAFQIRTRSIPFRGFLYLAESDFLRSILVVKGDQHFIIVKINRIDKGVYQHFPVALLGDIQLAETVEPEGHKFGADLGRFGQLLIGKTGFQFFFCRLQFFKALFRGFGQNTLLDRIYQVANLGIRFL